MELSFIRMLEGGASHGHDLVELAETAIPTFEALDDDRALAERGCCSATCTVRATCVARPGRRRRSSPPCTTSGPASRV